MKESKLFNSLVATFVIIVLGGPAVTLAGTPSHVQETNATVSYADLNLESEEGVRALYRRLQYASKEVCDARSPEITRSVFIQYQASACYRKTLSNAVEKFDNDNLTRMHAG